MTDQIQQVMDEIEGLASQYDALRSNSNVGTHLKLLKEIVAKIPVLRSILQRAMDDARKVEVYERGAGEEVRKLVEAWFENYGKKLHSRVDVTRFDANAILLAYHPSIIASANLAARVKEAEELLRLVKANDPQVAASIDAFLSQPPDAKG